MKNHFQPKVLWGQHRSELLPITIKDKLLKDRDLDSVPFIEFDPEFSDDYIDSLYERLKNQEIRLVDLQRRARNYLLTLREKHGPFLFNFHETYQVVGSYYEDKDIAFLVRADEYGKSDFLKTLERITHDYQGIRVSVNLSWGCYEIPDSPIVEFVIPEPHRLMQYPSPEVKSLVKKLREDKKDGDFGHKVANTQDPLFQATVDRYTRVIKSVLLRLREV